MYRISKKFKFDAAHQLVGLPHGHKCGNLHGHTYTVEVVIEGSELTKEKWLIDFGDLSVIKEWLDKHFDHRNLEDEADYQTTSENLAMNLFYTFEGLIDWSKNPSAYLHKVRVSETDATYAEYWR